MGFHLLLRFKNKVISFFYKKCVCVREHFSPTAFLLCSTQSPHTVLQASATFPLVSTSMHPYLSSSGNSVQEIPPAAGRHVNGYGTHASSIQPTSSSVQPAASSPNITVFFLPKTSSIANLSAALDSPTIHNRFHTAGLGSPSANNIFSYPVTNSFFAPSHQSAAPNTYVTISCFSTTASGCCPTIDVSSSPIDTNPSIFSISPVSNLIVPLLPFYFQHHVPFSFPSISFLVPLYLAVCILVFRDSNFYDKITLLMYF